MKVPASPSRRAPSTSSARRPRTASPHRRPSAERASVRLLGPGDEAALEAFLLGHSDSSLFLRSNARAAGLADTGELYSGLWVAAVEDGAVVGIAAHFWNGVVVFQAPGHAGLLARELAGRAERAVAGLAGPRAQLAAARAHLGSADADVKLDHRALLFALPLDELVVPEPLAAGRVTCGPPRGGERSTLVSWRMAYALETLGQERTPSLRDSSDHEIDQLTAEGAAFVLREGRRPVAFSAFNARVPDTVQVGGVYTPPDRRGRGFGRAVVAGSLLLARAEGVRRAVLFTEGENAAARRAYEALGFRVVGDYGMVLFR